MLDSASPVLFPAAYCCSFNSMANHFCGPSEPRMDRYTDVKPYEHNRVLLENGGYINASQISSEPGDLSGPWTFIATQGPLPGDRKESKIQARLCSWHADLRSILLAATFVVRQVDVQHSSHTGNIFLPVQILWSTSGAWSWRTKHRQSSC